MIDNAGNLATGTTLLPTTPVDLSGRIRALRQRAGLKQSDLARRMRLDPSIPSLWEQGKRPVPANRVAALAEALGVSLAELLEGADEDETGESLPPSRSAGNQPLGAAAGAAFSRMPNVLAVSETAAGTSVSQGAPSVAPSSSSLLDEPEPAELPAEAPAPIERRPRAWLFDRSRAVVAGVVPSGWEPGERVQDITASLPDGFWLDPVRLERASAKELLRARLKPKDRQAIEGMEVTGGALAQRLFQTWKDDATFVGEKLPLMERLFRAVLVSEYGGLTVDGALETLNAPGGRLRVDATLLRRLRDSLRPYPLVWVDRDLFR